MNRKIKPAIPIAAALLVCGLGLFAVLAPKTAAQSADLKVMVSDGMKTVVEELTPQIEQATGRKPLHLADVLQLAIQPTSRS